MSLPPLPQRYCLLDKGDRIEISAGLHSCLDRTAYIELNLRARRCLGDRVNSGDQR